MNKTVSLVNIVHNTFKDCATDEIALNQKIGALMVDYGKEPVVASMIECTAVAYTRLQFRTDRH